MSYQNEFVQVTNDTNDPIEWDSLTFNPGQRRVVPYMNMCNSYGDPASVTGRHQIVMMGNERGVVQPREVERDRAANYWGIKDAQHPMSWAKVPKLTFADIDGNKLWTPVEDPAGDHVSRAQITQQQQTDLEAKVRRQDALIQELLNIAGLDKDAIPQDAASVSGAPEIPYDDSTSDDTQSPWAHSGPVEGMEVPYDPASNE